MPPDRAPGPLLTVVRVSKMMKEDQRAATALLSNARRAPHNSVFKEIRLVTIFLYLSFYLQALTSNSGHLSC